MRVAEVKGRGVRRRRVVTVVGSGRVADPCCADVGRLIASLGFDLLTGGGGGVMEAVSRSFFNTSPRRGLVVAIVPGAIHPMDRVENREPADVDYLVGDGYPNEWVELAIFTHLPDSGQQGTRASSRNHMNVLSADAIVALPGREGTVSEIWLAVQYRVPIVAFGAHDGTLDAGVPRAANIDEVRAFLGRTAGGDASGRPRYFSSS